MFLLLTVLGTVAFVCFAHWLEYRQRQRRQQHLLARPVLDVDHWIATYVSPNELDRNTAMAVCGALGSALHCHVTQLRPDDGFDRGGILEPVGAFGIWEDDELDDFLERGLPTVIGKPLPSDAEGSNLNLRSIEDVIRYAARIRQAPVHVEGHN